MVSKVVTSIYSNNTTAGSSYQVADLVNTISSGSVDPAKSSNFIKVEVTFSDSSVNGTLKAVLYVSVNLVSTTLNFIPYNSSSTDNQFPIATPTNRGLYEHVQYPDLTNYYSYFKIYFGTSSSKIQVYVTTPNYNGKLLTKVTHMVFQ